MDEITSIRQIVQKAHSVNQRIGDYERHVIDPSTFNFSVKTSNGRLVVTPEQLQDYQHNSLTDDQLKQLIRSFVPRSNLESNSSDKNNTESSTDKSKTNNSFIKSAGLILLYLLGTALIVSSTIKLLTAAESFLSCFAYFCLGVYSLPIVHTFLSRQFNLKFGFGPRAVVWFIIAVFSAFTLKSNLQKAIESFEKKDISAALKYVENMSYEESRSVKGREIHDKVYLTKAVSELENAKLKESLNFFSKISVEGRTSTIDSIIRTVNVIILKNEIFGWWKGKIEGVQEETIRFIQDGTFHFNRFYEIRGRAQVYYEKGTWVWDGLTIKTLCYEGSLFNLLANLWCSILLTSKQFKGAEHHLLIHDNIHIWVSARHFH